MVKKYNGQDVWFQLLTCYDCWYQTKNSQSSMIWHSVVLILNWAYQDKLRKKWHGADNVFYASGSLVSIRHLNTIDYMNPFKPEVYNFRVAHLFKNATETWMWTLFHSNFLWSPQINPTQRLRDEVEHVCNKHALPKNLQKQHDAIESLVEHCWIHSTKFLHGLIRTRYTM